MNLRCEGCDRGQSGSTKRVKSNARLVGYVYVWVTHHTALMQVRKPFHYLHRKRQGRLERKPLTLATRYQILQGHVAELGDNIKVPLVHTAAEKVQDVRVV